MIDPTGEKLKSPINIPWPLQVIDWIRHGIESLDDARKEFLNQELKQIIEENRKAVREELERCEKEDCELLLNFSICDYQKCMRDCLNTYYDNYDKYVNELEKKLIK